MMKPIAVTVFGVAAMATLGLSLAANASAADRADDVVNVLTGEGYTVQLTGATNPNLPACTVTDVTKDSAGASPTAVVQLSCPTGC